MPNRSGSSRSTKLTELVGSPMQEIKEEFISVAEMQNQIMPDPELIESFGDYDVFGRTIPSTIVGGDFFDFIDLARYRLGGRLGVVIADASGHGLAAAMLIRDFNTALYTAISMQAHYEKDTSPLLFDKINRRMFRSSLPNQYIAAFYGELHLDGRLRYINAGHLRPLLFDGRRFEELEVGGPVLGAFYDVPRPYQVGEARLGPGGVLVCYTDGITEASNRKGEEFGLERLKGIIRRRRRSSSRKLFSAIIERVEDFARQERQSDDQTLLIIKH